MSDVWYSTLLFLSVSASRGLNLKCSVEQFTQSIPRNLGEKDGIMVGQGWFVCGWSAVVITGKHLEVISRLKNA